MRTKQDSFRKELDTLLIGGNISVAGFITLSIKRSGKTQRQIASENGYTRLNMITMLKQGHTLLPLDKVGPLATALEVNPMHLFKLVMTEYHPETLASLQPLLMGLELTEEELFLIDTFRKMTEGMDDKRELIGVVMK